MAPLSIIGALSTLPLALAHMQMSSPSPLRDPHANRPNEPKDYNMLSPLNADGSNFACKGYHLNTPLTTVATYAAGSKQTMKLLGSATHGGGSCQISLSCDGGSNFQVVKSIMGGCPLSDSYDFTIPSDIPAAKKCLLAWTWFNRIGNREMYMNCAVVDITNKSKGKRDSQASAAKALARYPDLFVANLADINSCKIPETTDAIFDNPGKDVSYGDGDSASTKSSFSRGQCTGKGSKSAGSKDTSSSNSGGQWSAPVQSTPSQGGGQSSGGAVNCNDGFYHATGCWGNARTSQQQDSQAGQQQQQQSQEVQQSQQNQQSQQSQQTQQTQQTQQKSKANKPVQQQLDAYLATLYGRSVARRNLVPSAEYVEKDSHEKEYPAQSTTTYNHTHTEHCKHKPTSYPPGSHYHNEEDLDPYPEDGIDYSNKDEYSNENSEEYKRSDRQKRWTSYAKRADGTHTPMQFHRVDESASDQQTSAQPSTQDSAQTANDTSVPMTPAEQFDAFLRRLVELSNNMASLIKYAAASSVNVPYYPSASTYDRAAGSTPDSAQNTSAVRRHARRALIYPGPSVGSISAPGDATDSDEGFKAWFPNLVQDLVEKRQLVDPVTSTASSDAGDGVNLFDALLTQLIKAFGDPFNILGGDDPETDPVPAPDSEPSPLDNPNVGIPIFDIPDLDTPYTPLPQIPSPPLPTPELIPGYELGPNGPIWVGEGPDPYQNDWSTDSPSITITIGTDDFPSTPTGSPTEISTDLTFPTLPTIACVSPIPQVGFNSCYGGCAHTPADLAAHAVYLQTFAQQQADYDDCVKEQTAEAPDASHRRPRPGHSHPLIPWPLPENFTGPFPVNESAPVVNGTAPTLGDIVDAILNSPDPDADSNPDSENATNPLQQAADAAEEGVTVPSAPVVVDPNALKTIADALPWFMGPGPVVTTPRPVEGEDDGGEVM